ncbi:MarR family transcriptional regulator [Secundilactobacillus pentosiphilus]|uniref:MarR family transcriptional regulator n=1 Tax=Secundilactobacillus pentosiphilus TaxID=1714682 RepID=A0A1Z5IY83_9LACO|nr:MarR family transcriptional regulator [Secundilactobacillus pentosiphilus]GAX06518.1 MarR family transcriptional regulator [Secundilactobacillus pentosiphilus]
MITDKNNETISKQLHTASNMAIRVLEKRLSPLGVNHAQFFFILKLHDNPGITQDQLVRSDSRHQSNVNREIAKLAKMGLVDKRQSPNDGRRFELKLTAEGEALYPKIKAALDAQEEALSQCLDVADGRVTQADFLAVLKRIAQLDEGSGLK